MQNPKSISRCITIVMVKVISMETLQIRIPKKILNQVDLLVKGGFYQNRSQILRQAVQKFIQESKYNGMAPYIVGPYQNSIDMSVFDKPLDALNIDSKQRAKIDALIENLEI